MDFGALRQTSAGEYALRFALGGLATVGTGLIAQHFGPLIGGVFLAFPAIFPASASLIAQHETRKKLRAGIRCSRRGRADRFRDHHLEDARDRKHRVGTVLRALRVERAVGAAVVAQ